MAKRATPRAKGGDTAATESERSPKRSDRKRPKESELRAEGEHGSKTHRRMIEQLEESPPRMATGDLLERARRRAANEGRRRLVADREQHDEAEKNSELKRAPKR